MENYPYSSEVFLVPTKDQLGVFVKCFIAKVNNRYHSLERPVGFLRAQNAPENLSYDLKNYCLSLGISIQTSFSYAPESNEIAERLVQEHWMWARVLMLDPKLPKPLWDEALHHVNWPRNRLPCSTIDNYFPQCLWSPRTNISFASIRSFETLEYDFVYYTKTDTRKLEPRAKNCSFVGMESNSKYARICITSSQTVQKVRLHAFRELRLSFLPSISALLNGLSRGTVHRTKLEFEHDDPEHQLHTYLCSFHVSTVFLRNPAAFAAYKNRIPHKSHTEISDGPPLPRSFREACKDPL